MSRAAEAGGVWSEKPENHERLKAAKRALYNRDRDKILTQQRAQYRADPRIGKRMAAQAKARYPKIRREAISHYSHGTNDCACCHETIYEFLSIDHLHGGGNKHRKSIGRPAGSAFCQWLKSNGWPEGYQVLCHNCNQAKGYYGQCPHQRAA